MEEDKDIERIDNADIDDIARRCVNICEEKKASNILLFDVRDNTILADYFLVCCGNSMAHVKALSENLRRTLVSEGYKSRGREGTPASQWIVLDFGVILIHIMTPEMRRHYCLEDLWDKRLIVYQGGEEMPEVSIDADDDDEDAPYQSQWEVVEDDEDEDDEWDEGEIQDDDSEVPWEEEDDWDDEEDEDDEDEEGDDVDDEEEWDDEELDEEWDEEDDWDEDDEDEEEPKKPRKDGGITPRDIFGDDDEETPKKSADRPKR